MQEHIQHIMLVDDEDDHHFITRLMLKKAGWTGKFTAFLSADDAVEYLCDTHARPDLLLVDINMPATNGFEFLALCERERLLDDALTTVVMCSSSNRPIDMEQSLRFKVVAEYVEKPLAVDQFQRISHDHLHRKRA